MKTYADGLREAAAACESIRTYIFGDPPESSPDPYDSGSLSTYTDCIDRIRALVKVAEAATGNDAMTGLRFERHKHEPLWTMIMCGELIIGHISGAGVEPGYRWSIGHRTTSLHGRSKTEAGARRGVRQAWSRFLARAGLVHRQEQ